MSGSIEARRIAEARTFTTRDQDVVVKLTGHDGRVDHLLFSRQEFARFAKQLHIDALMLEGNAGHA